MATFQNNKKKDWNSLKTGLVFVHGKVFKDESRNSPIFKMEPFAIIGNGSAYNQWTVLASCCGHSTIFNGKIIIGWKWLGFECGIRHTSLFCRHASTFFWKHQLLSVSLTFCFISKINYKNENWYHSRFHLLARVSLTEVTINICSEKMLLIKCRKNICEEVLF